MKNRSLGEVIRRVLAVLGVLGVILAVIRVRGSGGAPPRGGGWRELTGPDLR